MSPRVQSATRIGRPRGTKGKRALLSLARRFNKLNSMGRACIAGGGWDGSQRGRRAGASREQAEMLSGDSHSMHGTGRKALTAQLFAMHMPAARSPAVWIPNTINSTAWEAPGRLNMIRSPPHSAHPPSGLQGVWGMGGVFEVLRVRSAQKARERQAASPAGRSPPHPRSPSPRSWQRRAPRSHCRTAGVQSVDTDWQSHGPQKLLT